MINNEQINALIKHFSRDDTKTVMTYAGKVAEMNTASLIELLENNLLSIENKALRKRLTYVFIEIIQNLSIHGGKCDINQISTVHMTKTDNQYFLNTCNLMNSEEEHLLKSRIDKINNLEKEGLDNLFKETLQNQLMTDDGGAGLGLMDIARKSGNKLSYEFDKFDTTHSLFTMSVKINAA